MDTNQSDNSLDPEFKEFLLVERSASSNKHALISAFSEICVTLMLAFFLSYFFDKNQISLWVFVSILCSAFSWYSHLPYKRNSSRLSGSAWMIRSIFSSFLVGFMWGLAPVLFYEANNTYYIVVLVCLYAGYVSGALSVAFAHSPSFLAFALGITLPFASRMFYEDDSLTDVIGCLSIFYVICLTFVSRNMHDLFLKSARIQFDNQNLVKELAEKNKVVEQAVASKDRFLAAASHDLRQPLNAISLFVDALEPVQNTDLGKDILKKTRLSLKGLNGMLHSILDISRLDANSVEFSPNHISLNTLISQITDEYSVKTKHLKVSNNLTQDLIVFSDPTVLYRILHNIFDNAVKYTQDGHIKWTAKESKTGVVLEVKDSGIGIPKDKIDTVFDEFEQLNNPERNREKGLGLGLAIVNRLCNIANIEINIESILDQGTTVQLILPAGNSNAVKQITTNRDVVLDGKLVVVIDDEYDILFGMQRVISEWGCKVVIGQSQSEVLSALECVAKPPLPIKIG